MKHETFMKTFERHRVAAAACVLLLAASSCTEGDALPPGHVQQGSPAEVTLKLSATRETDVTGKPAGTRAVDDTDTAPWSAVKNVWVLQFDGQGDSAPLTGTPAYIAGYDTKPDGERICTLLAATGQTVWFLVNTFDTGMRWETGLTLGTLKNRYMNIDGAASMHGYGATVNPSGDFPDNADYHLLLNGIWQGDIAQGASLSAALTRNAARVDFLLKNNTGGAGTVTIHSVQLCNVPAVSFLYTGYTLPEPFPITTTGNPYLETIDYAPTAWARGADAGNGYTRFRFYLPANMRGVRSDITQTKDKNEYHPALATYVVVRGAYQESGTSVPVTYTVYPGANLTTDFNLRPNHAYTCTLDIDGANTGDPRVRTFGMRDFAAPGEERANCYMLNPNPAGTRQFRIPVDRINVFWGNQGYKNIPANTLRTSDNWTARILWCDFERSDDPSAENYFSLVKAAGTGSEGNADGYFTAEVGPGADGNALVAVEKNGTILWSWHLWITDYDPYAASISGSSAAQITDVPGGMITRFSSSSVVDNKYMVIMDRCLGQGKVRPDYQPLYQFGRKDPFAYSKADGAPLFLDDLVSTVNRISSTMNPTLRTDNGIGANADWLAADELRGNEWDDPLTTGANYVDYQTKSLFDPCPPGWKVPRTRTRLGPRDWTYAGGIYRLFSIDGGVCWTWVYEARCWTSASNATGNVLSNSANFANTTGNNTTNCARAQLLGIVPERMKY